MIIMGRDRKSKRSSAASCGMMMPHMAMMMPQAAAASRDSTSSDEEKDKTPALDPATTLKQLGRVNLAGLVFLLHRSFDGGCTSLLTVTGLLALLYMLTRLRPTSNLRDLCFLHHDLVVFCCLMHFA